MKWNILTWHMVLLWIQQDSFLDSHCWRHWTQRPSWTPVKVPIKPGPILWISWPWLPITLAIDTTPVGIRTIIHSSCPLVKLQVYLQSLKTVSVSLLVSLMWWESLSGRLQGQAGTEQWLTLSTPVQLYSDNWFVRPCVMLSHVNSDSIASCQVEIFHEITEE